MKMTLGTLLEEGKEKLEKAGVPDPLLDARFLLLDVFDMNFASFLVKGIALLQKRKMGQM